MNAHEYEVMFRVEETHWWYVGLHTRVFATLSRLHRAQDAPSWQILDAGCGTGAVAAGLRRFGTVRALDYSPLAIQFSQRRGLCGQLVQASVEALPLSAVTFDLVVSLDVLYMVHNDSRALGELYRVLKPGGILLLNLPAFAWLKGRHDLAVGTQRRYSPKPLRTQLEQAGFVVEQMSFGNSLPFPLAAPFRIATNLFVRDRAQATSDLFMLPSPLNRFMSWLMRVEAHLQSTVRLPAGMSLFVVAKKG